MEELHVVPNMLDLIEHTNGQVTMLMALAFLMGILGTVVLWVCPLMQQLETARKVIVELKLGARATAGDDITSRLRRSGM